MFELRFELSQVLLRVGPVPALPLVGAIMMVELQPPSQHVITMPCHGSAR